MRRWRPLKIVLAVVGVGIGAVGLYTVGVGAMACGVPHTAGPEPAPSPIEIARTEKAP